MFSGVLSVITEGSKLQVFQKLRISWTHKVVAKALVLIHAKLSETVAVVKISSYLFVRGAPFTISIIINEVFRQPYSPLQPELVAQEESSACNQSKTPQVDALTTIDMETLYFQC